MKKNYFNKRIQSFSELFILSERNSVVPFCEKELSSTLKENIDNFFAKQNETVNLLYLQNVLDEILFDHIDNRAKDDIKFKESDLLKYCFDRYKSRLPLQRKQLNLKDFKVKMDRVRKRRYISGVIALSDTDDQEILAVINSNYQLNFPKGKEDYLDFCYKKVTAFREFGEETGVWLSNELYKKARDYIEVNHYGQVIRLYFLYGIKKGSVKLNHKVNGEINGLEWRNINTNNRLLDTSLFRNVLAVLKYLKNSTKYPRPRLQFKLDKDYQKSVDGYEFAKKQYMKKQNNNV